VIVSLFILHLLEDEDARDVITKMKQNTKVKGLNVIAVFTKDGDFYRDYSVTQNFYANPGELKELYKEWEILEWEEKRTRAFKKTEQGEPMFNLTSFLLARKIK